MRPVPPSRFPSPLRYPGGKGKVANFIKLVFLQNDFVGYRYVEPYAGGASVALSLLYEEYASHVHINDLNRSVFAFWQATINNTEALCRRISVTAVTMEEWHKQKSVQQAKDPDPLDLAFSTFFLNRTNRSGIIDGGVIGGRKQGGGWKIDARYNTKELTRRIEKVARHKSRITLSQLDAGNLIETVVPQLPKITFIYLDPPYYVKGSGLYENFYKHSDHARVAELVRKMTRPWLVSYDACPEVLELYSGFERVIYGLSYSAADRYRGSEVMFFNPDLQLPPVSSPANIGAHTVDKERKFLVVA